ncbi:hypothetical protein [uncultured Vibrio sp.]|uniref:hypothetical protein n=1 Tax=uncultured Vibrio sp. TaxID=114054 RepID=UPI0025D50A0D|nr:hypothetical protein [uncultured Vibrio sp.]
MRPTPVRFAHSNRSASRRRSGFATAPTAKPAAPAMTLAEKTARTVSAPTNEVKAA